jgi:spore germination protein GerM
MIRKATSLALLCVMIACSGAPEEAPPAVQDNPPADLATAPLPDTSQTPPANTQSVTLHFADNTGGLAPESREIDASGTLADRARRCVEALLAGPRGRLRRVIPADTKLRALYIDTRGTATLDLDSAFARGLSEGSADALLAVWSLVNSLAVSFAEVRQVKLLVEGEERRDLGGHLDLSRPLSADMSLLDGTRRNP